MPDTPIDTNNTPNEDIEPTRPELGFDPGELAMHWASPFPPAELTPDEEKAIKVMCDSIGSIDVAARRWEVETAWQARLFDRGYQYLWPRRGGGWIYIPFSTDYQSGRNGQSLYGNETNIMATYGEIISAALTRDIPGVRAFPQNPSSDGDITAADAANSYFKVFARSNDLMELQHQLVYFLRTDGRALITMDHIVDAQRFGRCEPEDHEPVVPETEAQGPEPFVYAVQYGDVEPSPDDLSSSVSSVSSVHTSEESEELPLEQKGERQMDRVADWLKDKGIKLVVSSPDDEAMASAQVIGDKLGVQVEVDDRLASNTEGSEVEVESEDDKHDESEDDYTQESVPGYSEGLQSSVMDLLSNSDRPTAIVVSNSAISQIFQIFQGENIPPSSTTDSGWVAAITPNPDGTFKPSVVFPFNPPEESTGEQRGAPRGQEVPNVYGVLEHKVPFAAESGKLEDCGWVQVSFERDVTHWKAMFPDKADKIKPSSASGSEAELDRIARINSTLAIESNYVTGSSMIRGCTGTRTWFRPEYFMSIENVKVRASIMNKFPDGMVAVECGEEFIMARNECMDDHLTLIHAFPGSGMNRMALCSKILSVNKRLNTWMDLIDQYFIKCVPMRYMAQGPFDVAAVNDSGTVVGGFVPFLLDNVPPNRAVTDLIWQEPYPTAQPLMGDFIKFFVGELPQLLAHALPSLFGASANTDSGVAIGIQRDQALGCLGTPWHAINVATARYFWQGVRLAAQCRTEAVEGLDASGSKVRVELGNLKGNIMAYPESDANFPESWVQKQARWQELAADATSTLFQKLMSSIPNQIEAVAGIGIDGLEHPDKNSWDKQIGEFEVLLSGIPAPNPELIQAQKAIQESVAQIQAQQAAGVMAQPQELQRIQQMEQQLQSIPPLVSSVPIRDTDNHEVEAAACLEKINGPDGRTLADGNPEKKAAFQNLVLHYQEHEAKVEVAPELHDLPKGLTANLKDMPPDAAANLLTDAGLETKGQEVVQNREFTSELRKASRVTGPPVPGVGQ